MNGTKKKIAVLGGGTGALAAAFGITSQPGWKDRFEVTVYQMGWRLGGKGASGRNTDSAYADRIEEHGLHVWSGFYENAFRLIRACYDELGRAPDAPLGTWQSAFTPQELIVLEEKYNGVYYDWPFEMPRNLKQNSMAPGEPDAHLFLSISEYLGEGLDLIYRWFRGGSGHHRRPIWRAVSAVTFGVLRWGGRRLAHRSWFGGLVHWLSQHGWRWLARLFEWLVSIALRLFRWVYWRRARSRMSELEARKHWILLNFGIGNLVGMIRANVLKRGFDDVEGLDYRDWLRPNLYNDGNITIDSPMVWYLYEVMFAFRNGNHDKASADLSASVALNTLVRLGLTWKGAVIWKMEAGMGDAVFTPLYEVLKRRGVVFKFFHKVEKLKLSPNDREIAKICVREQARPTDPAGYDPLVTVKGLPCWPSQPKWGDLVDGQAMKQQGVDFEAWCDDTGTVKTLTLGDDFDEVVLGIPVGALPYICCDLIKANPDWKAMVDALATVRTQALQLWLKPTAWQLGWKRMGEPMLGTYAVTPLSTWADMTHLLHREAWPSPAGAYPLNIAYFCGVMPDDEPIPITDCGPVQDCGELSQPAATAAARATARDLLENHIGHLWPDARGIGNVGFDWQLLVDNRPGNNAGIARLDAQYARGNVQPTERYVLSLPGTAEKRLWPGGSGFDNLVLAGDWTQNGINCGCIEATVMSGLLASNAVAGYPSPDTIVGLTFGHAVP